LIGADLRGTNFKAANLTGAILRNAQFSNKTILPDDKKWTPETDMTRYTNPNHPDFWQPDWVQERDS
jgi:hypothetical protein